jgi:FkbM family methyltransferase
MNPITQRLKALLAHLGLQISRAPRPTTQDENAVRAVKVGKFDIVMRQSSPVFRSYVTFPDYGSVLGRLVSAMLPTYATLRVIDVGANCGDSVAIIKSAADVPVFAIEGDMNCFALLQQNMHQFRNVTIKSVFLGETTETIPVVLEKEGWNTTIIPTATTEAEARPIPLYRLDELLAEDAQADAYKILKVDAEGFDCKIIRGSRDYIARVKPALIFEYNRENMRQIDEDGLSTLWMLKSLGYQSVLLYDPHGRFITATTLDQQELIESLHYYADGTHGHIHYYDLCLFHHTDAAIAQTFIAQERHHA